MTEQSTLTERYHQQLTTKVERLTKLMQPFSPPPLSIFASPATHYRMRAEFRVWHDGDDLYYVMFDKQTKNRIRVTQFPVASRLINQAMTLLINYIKHEPQLKERLFQVDFLSSLSNKLIITLIYHKKLCSNWTKQALSLRRYLMDHGLDLQLIGRANKQKLCFDHDYIDEVLTVNQHSLIYRQVENSFTQPNAHINTHMLNWAYTITQNSQGDLLELYCGNGNFSLTLADNFRYVLATEINKAAVNAAHYNIEVNKKQNVVIVRLSAEEFTQAMQGVRQFNRLHGINLHQYDCQTILVDPPRSGLSHEALSMINQYTRIIYISCNPSTLQDNLMTLTQTHHLTHFALFDQFPFTDHIECGVVLERR